MKKPIITSMQTKRGKVCVYTEETTEDRGQGHLIALDFIAKGADSVRLASAFLTRSDVKKSGGLKAIRNRILDDFSEGNPERDSENRFNKAISVE